MRDFKKPNLNASRYRPEVYNVMNKEFFDSFKKKYPKYQNLDNKDIRKIIKSFNEFLYETVIETRDGVQLPEAVGWLFIGTCKNSMKENIDYAKSNKYGVAVSNKNWETDGKLAKIFYTNYALKHKMKNREFWGFVACRDFKRNVSRTYSENWNMYLVVDSNKKLKLEHARIFFQQSLANKTAKELKQYNEFEL